MPFLSASSKRTKPTAPAAQEMCAGKAPSPPPPRDLPTGRTCGKVPLHHPVVSPGSSLRRRSPPGPAAVMQHGRARGGGDGAVGLLAAHTAKPRGLTAEQPSGYT